MINLHPSLLPLYPGLDTYQRAIDAADQQHGASIHFLTAELDGGPVIAQVRIPLLPTDDKKSLSQRLAPQEHRLMVASVELFQQGRVECRASEVMIDGASLKTPLVLGDDGPLDGE